MKKYKEKCHICENIFIKRSNNQIYCSKECHKQEHIEYMKKYIKKYYKLHKKEILKKQKKYQNKHKKEIAIKNHKWYLKNRKKFLKQIKKYQKKYKKEINQRAVNKLRTNINFKLSVYLRNRIRKVLKGNPKSETTMKLVGCSIEKLKKHLEKKFKSGMSFSNYGKWHIDHIIPCARFNLIKKSEQRKCFYYTNLQPLWAKENLRKGDKL